MVSSAEMNVNSVSVCFCMYCVPGILAMFRPDSLITVFVIGVPLKKRGLTCGLIGLDTLWQSLHVKHHG